MTKERINLAVSQKTKAKLEELQERLDSASLTEVIRRAVQLLDVVTDKQAEGGTLLHRSKDGKIQEIRVVL